MRSRLAVPLPLLFLATLLSGPVRAQRPTPGTVATELKVSQLLSNFAGNLDDLDAFGSAVVSIGDLDGDGNPDLALGAPGDDDAADDAGAVWILFTDEEADIVDHVKIRTGSGGFSGALGQDDEFGSALAYLGDLDGDGNADLAVGAPGDDSGGSGRGAVYVLRLREDGTVQSHTKLADGLNGFNGILDDGDGFGSALAGLGDLDGDGSGDLAVGVQRDGDGGALSARGGVYILFLSPFGQVLGQQKISDVLGDFTGELDDFDQFGSSVANLGDVDGDGTTDLAVGAFGDDDGGPNHGAVWVLFLGTDGKVDGYSKISSEQGGFAGVLNTADAFGVAAAGLGDVNGDRIPDLAVGVYRGVGNRGAVWVLYLDESGDVMAEIKIDNGEGGFDGFLAPGDRFGSALASLEIPSGNAILDPGFEEGAGGASWTQESTSGGEILCVGSCGTVQGTGPRSGTGWAWFGGVEGESETDSIEQDVLFLSDTFEFYLHTPESSGREADRFRVFIDGTREFQTKADSETYDSFYKLVSIDVTAYHDGGVHSVVLESSTQGNGGATSFFVDELFLSRGRGDTVELVCGAPGDDDGGEDRGASWTLRLAGPLLAAYVPRNGGGANEMAFTASGGPVPGATWEAAVDAGDYDMTGIMAFASPGEGLMTNFGEVLVDLASPMVFVDVRLAGEEYENDLPNDTDLLDLTFSAQGLRFGVGQGVELLNALDLTVGYAVP